MLGGDEFNQLLMQNKDSIKPSQCIAHPWEMVGFVYFARSFFLKLDSFPGWAV